MKDKNGRRQALMLVLAVGGVMAGMPWSGGAAEGATYTYTNTVTGTGNWSGDANWSATPVSGSDTQLVFNGSGSAFGSSAAVVSNNDIGGNFLLNALTLNGAGPAATPGATLTIQGSPMVFSGSGAQVNLNATGTTMTYLVSTPVALNTNTTFTGAGNATFYLSGALTGSGGLTKSGSSTLTLGASNVLYSGDVRVTGGTLRIGTVGTGSAIWASTGALTVSSGGTFFMNEANVGVSGLYGNGNLGSAGYPNQKTIVVNYNGATADTFSGSAALQYVGLTKNGTGNLTLTAGLNGFGNQTVNWGALEMPAVTGTSAQGLVANGGTVKLTGTSGTLTGLGIMTLNGGTIWVAPGGSVKDQPITVTGQTATSGSSFSAWAGTLVLDRGQNASMSYQIGNTAVANLMQRAPRGSLVIAPAHGMDELGKSERFVVFSSASTSLGNALVNGLVNPGFVGQNNDSYKSGEFLTYSGTMNTMSDVGFVTATYSTNNNINSAGATAVYDANSAKDGSNVNTLTGPAQVYALNTRGQTINLGTNTLSMGTGAANTQGGIIVNGGSITGGTVALSAAEGTFYVSAANGTISSVISSTSSTTSGITVFGPGVLTLGTANTYRGKTTIEGGATLQVTITANGGYPKFSGAQTSIIFRNGVLQSSGTLSPTSSINVNGDYTVGWDSNAGGGFAAKGGTLTTKFNVTGGVAGTLQWRYNNNGAGTSSFVPDGAPLLFGSATADSQVDFQNPLDLGGNTINFTRVINVAKGVGGDSAKLSGNISSTSFANGIAKDGAGTLIFSGSHNSFTGDLVVNQGTMMAGSGEALSISANKTTINSGATLDLGGQTINVGKMIVLNGVGTGNGGALVNNNSSSAAMLGTGVSLSLISASTNFTSAPTIAFDSGNASASVSLYNGNTVNLANITLNPGSGYTAAPTVTISGGGGQATAVAGIGSVVLASNASIGGSGNMTINPVISGVGQLTKVGAGTLTLAANNTYSGGTVIEGGTLAVGADAALGDVSHALAINNGTLQVTNGFTTSRTITLGSAATIQVDAGALVLNNALTGSVSKSGAGSLLLSSLPTGTLSLASGTVQLANGVKDTPTHLANLNVTFSGGKLDLGNNDLIIANGSAEKVSSLTTLAKTGAITSSWTPFTGGTFTGTITPAVVLGSDFQNLMGGTGAQFDGQTVNGSDILIKNTYAGDANLDGQITMDDYLQIDAGYLFDGSGWLQGDFDHNGVIDGNDYLLIDANYLAQKGPLAMDMINLHASWFGASYEEAVQSMQSVPEPASLGLLALAGLGLLRRRR